MKGNISNYQLLDDLPEYLRAAVDIGGGNRGGDQGHVMERGQQDASIEVCQMHIGA
jgi:hypothetical protein